MSASRSSRTTPLRVSALGGTCRGQHTMIRGFSRQSVLTFGHRPLIPLQLWFLAWSRHSVFSKLSAPNTTQLSPPNRTLTHTCGTLQTWTNSTSYSRSQTTTSPNTKTDRSQSPTTSNFRCPKLSNNRPLHSIEIPRRTIRTLPQHRKLHRRSRMARRTSIAKASKHTPPTEITSSHLPSKKSFTSG